MNPSSSLSRVTHDYFAGNFAPHRSGMVRGPVSPESESDRFRDSRFADEISRTPERPMAITCPVVWSRTIATGLRSVSHVTRRRSFTIVAVIDSIGSAARCIVRSLWLPGVVSRTRAVRGGKRDVSFVGLTAVTERSRLERDAEDLAVVLVLCGDRGRAVALRQTGRVDTANTGFTST